MARLARIPIQLYKLRLGWLLDSRFLLLNHRGRKSGQVRHAVLEIVARDRNAGHYFVASPWKADWFANVSARPRVEIVVGRKRLAATADVLSPAESYRILSDYRKRHRLAAWALAKLLGHSDFESAAGTLVVVRFSLDGG